MAVSFAAIIAYSPVLIIPSHIFLELCTGGDLFTFISSRQSLHEGESKYIMYQLLKGIEYLHNRHISHRGRIPYHLRIFG